MTAPIGITLSLDGVQQTEAGLRRVAGGVDSVGVSAKQTAAALRGVPAQFTDIITSLQGGQAPLTVFLQQGGQLKDMFGGAGAAAQALGGYVVGLVNPFTVAAAAGVTLALAYNQGSKEADAYNKAIALTGNIAGVTTAQLQGMAERVSGVVGTQAKAAEVIAQLVGTGGVTSQNIERFAATAIQLERNVGVAVKDTIKEFAELGKEPVEASRKLNERYNFLTAAVYEQIKALQEQGKASDAAALSQQTYDKAMSTVAATLEGKLGLIERAWRNVGDTAKAAWDKMLNVGRPDTLTDQLSRAQRELEGKLSTPLAVDNPAMRASREKGIEALRNEINLLQEQERMMRRGADAQAQRAKAEKAGIEAADALYKAQEKGLSKQQQLNAALKEYRGQLEALRAVNPNSERLAPDAVARGERAIRDQFKPAAGGTVGQSETAELRAQADAAEKYLQQLRERGVEAEKLTAGELRAAKIREQLKTGLTGQARAEKELALVQADRLAVAERLTVTEEQQQKAIKKSADEYAKLIEATFKAADALQDQAEKQEAANSVYGKGAAALDALALSTLKARLAEAEGSESFTDKYIAGINEQIKAQERLNAARAEGRFKEASERLDRDIALATQQQALYADEARLVGLSALERAKIVASRESELVLARELDAIEKSGFDETQKDLLRQKAAERQRISSSAAVNKVIQDDFAKTSEAIERNITDALMRGFESGKDFAKVLRDTIVNMFKTLVLRPIISAIISPVAGGLAGIFGGGGGGGVAGAAGGAISTASNAFSLFNGGKQLYTLGSQYLSGSMSGANVVGSLYGNATGAGIDGLLATNGAYGTAGTGAGAASPWASAALPAAAAAAIAAVVLNALGAFRSERRVGSGLMGTLGKGDLTPFEEWRKGGTLFSGPSYTTSNPVAELEAKRKQLQDLKDAGQGNTQLAATLQMIIDNLEAQYGDLAAQAARQSKAIQTAYDSLRTNVGDMADVLGISSDAVRKFTTTLGGADGKGLNFEGLNSDQVAAKISEALATANNELAQQVIGKFVTTTTRGTRIVTESTGSQGEDRSTIYSEVDDTRTTTRYVASQYARDGEKAIDTLTRLATSLSTVNDAFGTLGVTLLDASLSGANAASALADAFGGLERMAALTRDYYQNYYTEEERKAKQKADLDKRFADLGIKTPGSRDEFRQLVTDQLNQVEVQRKNRDNLVSTVGTSIASLGKTGITSADLGKLGFSSIDPALLGGKGDPAQQEKLKKFLDGVNGLGGKGLDDEAFRKGLSGLIDANSEILGIGKDAGKTAAALLELSGAFAELNESAAETSARLAREAAEARDRAFRGLENAINAEKKLLDAQLEAAQEVADNLSGLFDVLRSNVRELYNEVDSTRAASAEQGSAFITQALATARSTGYLPETDQITRAIEAVRSGFESDAGLSQFAKDRDRLVLAGQLAELEGITGKQLSDAERQINAIKDQTKRLDETLEYWKKQIDIANGNLDATLTVAQAINDLKALMFPETNLKAPEKVPGSGGFVIGGGGGVGGGPSKPGSGFFGAGGTEINDAATVGKLTSIRNYTNTLDFGAGNKIDSARELAAQANERGVSATEIAIATGYRVEDVERLFADAGVKVPRFEGGGAHMGGLRIVGERGWEVEATGPARIWNQQQLAGALGGGSNSEVVAELQALRAAVQVLEEVMAATARNTAAMPQLADQFDSVTAGGSTMRNTPVTA